MRDKFSFGSGVPDRHETLSSLPEQFSDAGQKAEAKAEMAMDLESFSEEKLKCGWLFFRPAYLQRFRTAKWALFWLCWAGAMQGLVVNGFINVVITTIERRYDFRSSQTGLIAGGYDIASFLLLVPVSYFGGRFNSSKPRYIGIGVLVMGLGNLLFASPHFLSGPYRGTHQVENTCRVENATSSDGCSKEDSADVEPYSGLYLMIFLSAQLLHGAGASPFYTLGVTYLDENVSKKMSSVYLGIFYTMAIIGPACGYLAGGELLKIYTDFLIVDSATIGLTADSNVWIGAWWVGFLATAAICFVIAIPLLAFPAVLPGSKELAKEKVSEAHESSGAASTPENFSKVREIPRALLELLGNPAFFMLNLAGATEGLLMAGFAAFLPKVIENQFSVSASLAALLVGAVTVPAGGGGTFIGGYLIKRWNMPCSGILKYCMFATAFCVLFTFCFLFNCPNLEFAGLTVPYSTDKLDLKSLSLDSKCNSHCTCNTLNFSPICGVDDVAYYSPCYAGCSQENYFADVKIYTECSCIEAAARTLYDPENPENPSNRTKAVYEAINTNCPSKCGYLWIFMILAFCTMFMTFVCTMPALSATLRVVREDQRSFALGIQWIKVRMLGTIPAPMIFGALIDDTCILWHKTCDGQGACLVYDNYYMSRYMFGLAFIGKSLSLLFFFLSWWTYVPPGSRRVTPELRPRPRRH